MQGHVHGRWNGTDQRYVGGVVDDDHGFVYVVPIVVVDVNSVEIIALCDGAVAKGAVFIGVNFNGKCFAQGCVNKFDGFVGKNIATERHERVCKDGPWHGHPEVIGRHNAHFNGIGQEHFFSVVELSDHVVGPGKETGFVEGSRFNHRT